MEVASTHPPTSKRRRLGEPSDKGDPGPATGLRHALQRTADGPMKSGLQSLKAEWAEAVPQDLVVKAAGGGDSGSVTKAETPAPAGKSNRDLAALANSLSHFVGFNKVDPGTASRLGTSSSLVRSRRAATSGGLRTGADESQHPGASTGPVRGPAGAAGAVTGGGTPEGGGRRGRGGRTASLRIKGAAAGGGSPAAGKARGKAAGMAAGAGQSQKWMPSKRELVSLTGSLSAFVCYSCIASNPGGGGTPSRRRAIKSPQLPPPAPAASGPGEGHAKPAAAKQIESAAAVGAGDAERPAKRAKNRKTAGAGAARPAKLERSGAGDDVVAGTTEEKATLMAAGAATGAAGGARAGAEAPEAGAVENAEGAAQVAGATGPVAAAAVAVRNRKAAVACAAGAAVVAAGADGAARRAGAAEVPAVGIEEAAAIMPQLTRATATATMAATAAEGATAVAAADAVAAAAAAAGPAADTAISQAALEAQAAEVAAAAVAAAIGPPTALASAAEGGVEGAGRTAATGVAEKVMDAAGLAAEGVAAQAAAAAAAKAAADAAAAALAAVQAAMAVDAAAAWAPTAADPPPLKRRKNATIQNSEERGTVATGPTQQAPQLRRQWRQMRHHGQQGRQVGQQQPHGSDTAAGVTHPDSLAQISLDSGKQVRGGAEAAHTAVPEAVRPVTQEPEPGLSGGAGGGGVGLGDEHDAGTCAASPSATAELVTCATVTAPTTRRSLASGATPTSLTAAAIPQAPPEAALAAATPAAGPPSSHLTATTTATATATATTRKTRAGTRRLSQTGIPPQSPTPQAGPGITTSRPQRAAALNAAKAIRGIPVPGRRPGGSGSAEPQGAAPAPPGALPAAAPADGRQGQHLPRRAAADAAVEAIWAAAGLRRRKA